MTPVPEAVPVAAAVRQVLSAPRGHRFTHTRAHPPLSPRQEEILTQMGDNPRVARRLKYGTLPTWMHVAAQQDRAANPIPHPRPTPEDLPAPPKPPPLPCRPRSHRKPRRKIGWPLTAYGLAASAGAVAYHLTTVLF